MEGLYKANVLGRERDIFFGMPAIEYVFSKADLTALTRITSGNLQTTDTKLIAHFVYAGLSGGADRKDEVIDFDFGQVYDAVERMVFDGENDKVMESVGKAFSESYALKKIAEALKGDKGTKKKGGQKKSSGMK